METDSDNWTQGRQLLLRRCKSRALLCLKEHEYSRAFAHFIIVLTVEPSVKGELLNAFLYTLEKVAGELEKDKQINEVIMCYEQALEVLPNDSHVLHGLATTLYRLGYVECALSYFLKSYRANPFFTPALYCMENLKNALVERWHFIMLNDTVRNNAFKRAINKAIKKGYNSVLDIGSGSGILSLMALDAGAANVYACEESEIMFEVLQNVMKTNDKSIKAFLKNSTDLKIPEDVPEKINLIVTEIFDAALFGENCLETLNHAWEFLLQDVSVSPFSSPELESPPSLEEDINKNNADCSNLNKSEILTAKVIPHSATVYAVPIECERLRKNYRLEPSMLNVLNLKENIIPQVLDEEPYTCEKIKNVPGGYKMLSCPISILKANFNSHQEIKDLLQGKVLKPVFKCSESGNLDAFVVWFDLHLDDEELISSAPENISHNCCWDQAIYFAFPQLVEGPSHCQVSELIEAEFLCKGHLQLRNVKIGQGGNREKLEQRLTMDPVLIYFLNTYSAEDLISLNLRDLFNVDNATVLDISTFPILGLKSLKDKSSNYLTVLRSQYETEVVKIQDFFKIPDDRIVFKSYEDFYLTKMQNDFLIVDPVEPCGLLKKNLFEDVSIMKMQCLKSTGLVVPGEIELFAALVESETLEEYSKIVSDDKVAGYKISQILNSYQCRIHQDIQLSALPHQRLTETIKLTHINLNDTDNPSSSCLGESQKVTEVEIVNSGKVTAVVYWFGLKYHSSLVVNTSDPASLYKQAACLLEEVVPVSKGEKICLQWSLKNSCLQMGIYDKETSVLK